MKGVMAGALGEFDLAQILQVVGIGRQYTGVELRHDDRPTGTIFVKSGKVVSAKAADTQGKEALFRLFVGPNNYFQVYRMETPALLPEPLGAVASLVIEAIEQLQRRDTARKASVVPKPVSSSRPQPAIPQRASSISGQHPAGQASAASSPSVGGAAVKSVRSPEALQGPSAGSPVLKSTVKEAPLPDASAEPQQLLEDDDWYELNTAAGLSVPAAAAATATEKSAVVLAVVSPKGGVGKTTVSLNLALALARQKRRVILVDADINGDVLSAVNGRNKAQSGTYDILTGQATLAQSLLSTMMPNFKILPACGPKLPPSEVFSHNLASKWQALLSELAKEADVVVVDTPAGMFGVTQQVLEGSTHALGVLQGEVIAQRSFSLFTAGMNAIPQARRPEIAGVVLNMLQLKHSPSLNVLQLASTELPSNWLFDTSIPRNDSFLYATQEGLPLRLMDETSPPAVSWLFDTLAAEFAQRVKLTEPSAPKAKSFLL